MPDEILTLPPGGTEKLFAEGQMKKVDQDPVPKQFATIEQAEHIFQKDFLGANAIQHMNELMTLSDIKIQFVIPEIDFPYTLEELNRASEDDFEGKTRMCVLRPSTVLLNKTNSTPGIERPITIDLLYKIFFKNPFGTGKVFQYDVQLENPHPLDQNHYLKQSLKAGYALPTMGTIPNSSSKDYHEQTKLLEIHETRRTAVEAVWDTIAMYGMNHKKLLADFYDWTSSGDSGYRFAVGNSNEGIFLQYNQLATVDNRLGVCTVKNFSHT